mmetsp:Transcript_17367/g.27064  ORF Transcript_17367/g.27064 Transcript_17367/m.27064 type:complete len:311 (-) Transcript_17367:518-1450(-)
MMTSTIRISTLLITLSAASAYSNTAGTPLRSSNGFTTVLRPSSISSPGRSKGVSRGNNSRSAMSMHTPVSAAAGVGVAAIGGVIGGGLFAGGLHAVAGPDHLAALLPRTVGQRWYRAGRTGALWGVGHGISVTILGMLGYALKSRISMSTSFGKVLHGASHCLEAAVGLSLVVIGLMGLKEAREWEAELEDVDPTPTKSLSAAGNADEHVTNVKNRAVVFNGLLHGFSWDGAPSLAPALAVASWRGNIAFLLAYALGTMGAMAVTTTLIGEGTRQAGAIFHRPDLPQKLSFFSSLIAIIVGAVWTGLAFV